jgi:FkbM family methyltransferase
MSEACRPRGEAKKRFAFLVIGTRGDVQPLAILAANLAAKHDVFFVTNRNNRFSEAPLKRAGVQRVDFLSLPSVTPRGGTRVVSEHQHRAECVDFLEDALGCRAGHQGGESTEAADGETFVEEASECLVVINLFAVEGFHIAEALGVPCAIVSPCHIPYDAPRNVVRDIKQGYPGLYDAEVEHWAWVLFDTTRWAHWRVTELGLDDVPFLERPMKTQLIYAIPPSIYPIPGYLPDTVRATGFFFPPEGWEREVIVPTRMQNFFQGSVVCIALSTCWDKMGTLGNDEDAIRFIRACHSSLKSLGLRGFLLLSTLDSVLGRAWTSVFRKRKLANDSKVERETNWLDGDDVLQAYVGSFPYEQLFSFCFAAFHHGGSGSVAEAIRAGIPQIILPTVFDQQHWAERMQWLSVAKILSRTEQSKSTNIDENELFMAFEFLNSTEARENARNLRETIRGNESNGVNDTAELLESFAETKSSRRSNPSVTVRLKNGWRFACNHRAREEVMYLYDEIVERSVYFRNGIRPKRGGIIFDVGANIGMFLLAVHEQLRVDTECGWERYIAFEPLQQNIDMLRKNANAHGVGRYDIVQCGISDADGNADFVYFAKVPGNSTMHIKEKLELQSTSMNPNLLEDRQNSRCALRTLSSILDDEYSDIERIDLLKIDVEGSELLVLRGISKTHMKLIQQLVLEVHDVDGRLAEVLQLLTMSGFDCSTESGESGARAFIVYATRS